MENNLQTSPSSKNIGILAISSVKFAKAILLLAIAFGLFSVSKMDTEDLEGNLASYLHIDTESRLWIKVSNAMDELTSTKIRLFGSGFMFLAFLNFFQGYGLILRWKWAALLILMEDFFFIPIEVYELFEKFRFKLLALLCINLLIAFYLLNNWLKFEKPSRIQP